MQYLRLTTVAWGTRHTRLFSEVCLPSLLAPRNLPSIWDDIPLKYRVYTSRQDADFIRKCFDSRGLDRHMDVEIHADLVDKLLQTYGDKHQVHNLCHADAIRDTNTDDGAWSFILPDVVYGNGCFSTVGNLLKSGKRLILTPAGLRTYKDLLLPILKGKYSLHDGSISVPNNDLVKLSIEFMGPGMKNRVWGNYIRPSFHWGVFWKVDNRGMLQHSYQPNPILIYPQNKNETIVWKGISVEATDYLERAVPDSRDVCIVRDTDEFYMCTLDDYDTSTFERAFLPESFPRGYLKVPSVVEFALIGKNYVQGEYARKFSRTGIRYRYPGGSVDDEREWRKVEALSNKFTRAVFIMMELFHRYPVLERMAKKFRDLEDRVSRTRRRIQRSVWLSMFALIELAVVAILGCLPTKRRVS